MISWNLGPLHLSAALPYIAQTMQKGAAVVLLQEVLIHKGTTVEVRRELRQMFPKYKCYIAAGSHVDVGNDENDRTLIEECARSNVQITVVTFLYQATAKWHDLQRQVTYLLRAMIEVTSTRHSLAMATLSLQVRYMTRWTSFSRTSCIQRMEH